MRDIRLSFLTCGSLARGRRKAGKVARKGASSLRRCEKSEDDGPSAVPSPAWLRYVGSGWPYLLRPSAVSSHCSALGSIARGIGSGQTRALDIRQYECRPGRNVIFGKPCLLLHGICAIHWWVAISCRFIGHGERELNRVLAKADASLVAVSFPYQTPRTHPLKPLRPTPRASKPIWRGSHWTPPA